MMLNCLAFQLSSFLSSGKQSSNLFASMLRTQEELISGSLSHLLIQKMSLLTNKDWRSVLAPCDQMSHKADPGISDSFFLPGPLTPYRYCASVLLHKYTAPHSLMTSADNTALTRTYQK